MPRALSAALVALAPAAAVAAAAGGLAALDARAAGLFTLEPAAGSDVAACAPSLNHRAGFAADGAADGVWRIAHSGIDHVGSTCVTPNEAGKLGYMRVYGEGVDGGAVVAGARGDLPDVVGAGGVFALESDGRYCGKWTVPAGSVFAFVSAPAAGLELSSPAGVVDLTGGRDYLLTLYATTGAGPLALICIYGRPSVPLSGQPVYAAVGNASTGAAGGARGAVDSVADGAGGKKDGWWTAEHIGIVAGGAGGGLLLLAALLTCCCCCVARRRRRTNDDGGYYKFEGGSARNSGSVNGGGVAGGGGGGARTTPWQARHSGKRLPDLESGGGGGGGGGSGGGAAARLPAASSVWVDRPEPVSAPRASAESTTRRDSYESGLSVEINAPMLSPEEARTLSMSRGDGDVFNARTRRG